MLDISGNNEIYYHSLANKILAGEKLDLPTGQPKAITSFYDDQGEKVDMEKSLPDEMYGMVSMHGPIIKYGDYCTWGADEIVARLQQLNNMDKVKGIILEIDGPGGSVSAIAPFQQFAKEKKKPVIVVADQMASAHYYIACEVADRIYAGNDISAMIGSVGVVVSFVSPTDKFWEERNMKFHEVYAEESKDKNKPFSDARDGKYELLKKDFLSPMAIKFQNAVKNARAEKLKEEDGVLSGKMFFAEEALRLGMIDGIKSISDAIDTIKLVNPLIYNKL